MTPQVTKESSAGTQQSEFFNLYNITTTTSNYSQSASIDLYDLTPEAVIVPCVFGIILIVGVVGNTLLILSFARHKTLSTPHNALVVNLASGDFIYLLISLPFNSTWYTLPSWPYGLVICKLSHYAEHVAMTVVISTLSVLSVERCLIVTGKKLWHQQKRGPIWLTTTIWTISLLVSLPSLISPSLVINKALPFCYHYDESMGKMYSKAHVAFMFIFLFCLPLLVIATAYILIAVHLLLRAFPLSQGRATVKKQKSSVHYQCCVWRKTTKIDFCDDSRQNVDVIKEDIYLESKSKEEEVFSKTEQEISKTEQESRVAVKEKTNSKSSLAKDDDKSCSTDSCTETTDLQPTPIYPYSFVYTDPIPEDAVPKQEANYSKMRPIPDITTESKDPTSNLNSAVTSNCSSTSWKETTPLNPSSSIDVKNGYRQRQQSLVTKRRRLALTVLMLIIAFAVCWTPRHVYLLWFHFLPEQDYDTFWHVFKIIGFCMSSSNSAVNPAVFYILDTTYRSFVHRSICMLCIRLCRPKTSSGVDAGITIGERDYNATIAMTDMKSKANMTEL